MKDYDGYTQIGSLAFDRIQGSGAAAVYPPNATNGEAQRIPEYTISVNVRAHGADIVLMPTSTATDFRTIPSGESLTLPLDHSGALQFYMNQGVGGFAEIIFDFDRPSGE